MATDPLSEFRALLASHASNINVDRLGLARRVASVVAASGDKPLQPVDITVAMARIDTILDEYYGKDGGYEESVFGRRLLAEADRAEQLAKVQSNRIIEEELEEHPDLIEMLRIQ